ncbi:hypothetical protein WICPIJ_002140 [Wickerhamomyces pijperi]|uniref:TATA-binding protein interacting (TIP20) domain-containing protein n=1 Tax=Wickerhamomyces pijperi TaxID=599730 RepID=A0A9P8QAD9_WICPI|nr:hypothetical protein WICPIJ_002140 [Wickerhamomyces pijperi]
MSVDFQNVDRKLKEITEKSRDVDPDLRFMAVTDLNKLVTEQKSIISTVDHYSKKATALLLEALNDVNSDIQSQALKCFAPLTPTLTDGELINVFLKLNEQIVASNSITTSVYTMAILEILKNINLKHSSTGQEIASKLIGWNVDSQGRDIKTTLDAIETVTEVIKNIGNTLTQPQKGFLCEALIRAIYSSQNIISKRSITALGFLVPNLDNGELNFLIGLIQQRGDGDADQTLLTLLSYISIAGADGSVLEPFFENVFNFTVKHLSLASTGPVNEDGDDEEEEEIEDEDQDSGDEADNDDQQKADDIRYESLRLISSLLPIGESLNAHIPSIINIIKQYLKYDPYSNTDDDEDEDELEMDDLDDEYDELDDGSEDSSWKLRKQSAELVSDLVGSFPLVINQVYNSGLFELILKSIVDANESVTIAKLDALKHIIEGTVQQHSKIKPDNTKRRGSDFSMVEGNGIDSSLSQLATFRTQIVNIITKELKAVKSNNAQKYNTFLGFFQIFNNLNEDLTPLLKTVREHNFGLNLDLLTFYSKILENNDLQFFDQTELNYVVCMVNDGLRGSSHISILNSIQTAIDINNLKFNEQLLNSIVALIENPKNDSELRNTAIEALSSIDELPSHDANQLLVLFATTVRNEHTALSSIHSITKLISVFYSVVDQAVISQIVNEYKLILLSQRFQTAIIESLVEITRHFTIDVSIAEPLKSLFNESSTQSSVIKILAHLRLPSVELKEIYLRASQLDEIDDEALTEVGVEIGSDLIPVLQQSSTGSNQRNIKVMAAIIAKEQIIPLVKQSETELKSGVEPLFNIKLLGYLSQFGVDVDAQLDDLTKFFENEELKFYAAETLGNIIAKNYQDYINVFLQKILAGEQRQLLLLAIKQVLKVNKHISVETCTDIWNTVMTTLESLEEIDDDICKISAQIIGYILVQNCGSNYFFDAASQLLTQSHSKAIIYSIIASVKFILAYDNIISLELMESLLLQSFAKITDEDLKIKQISVIALVTTLNNQFNLVVPYLDVILPNIYEELKARKQYEHVITIGPFKHRVDKALEIRKNSFEILYKLCLNHSILTNVDFNVILSHVAKAGIVADILTISSLIITKLLEFDDVSLTAEDKTFMKEGIDKMLTQIKRKEDSQKETKDDQENKNTLTKLRKLVFVEDHL